MSLDATLSVTLGKGSCENEGATTGPTLEFKLRGKNTCPKTYAGSVVVPINSANAYVSLPMQPGQVAGLVAIHTGDAEFSLRLTRADDTTLVIALQGLFIYEVPGANLVTLIEVQGVGDVAWHASGPLGA